MAQFDVFRTRRPREYPLVVDVQSDFVSDLPTRVVIPMTPAARYPATPVSRLNPSVLVGGTDYLLIFQEIAAVPSSALGPKAGSLANRRAEIIAALDLLFAGF